MVFIRAPPVALSRSSHSSSSGQEGSPGNVLHSTTGGVSVVGNARIATGSHVLQSVKDWRLELPNWNISYGKRAPSSVIEPMIPCERADFGVKDNNSIDMAGIHEANMLKLGNYNCQGENWD